MLIARGEGLSYGVLRTVLRVVDEAVDLDTIAPYVEPAETLVPRRYPPALITTSLADDRVHPAHALKFHARLREIGVNSRLYAPEAGGHAGNASQEEVAAELAAVLVFLRQTVCK